MPKIINPLLKDYNLLCHAHLKSVWLQWKKKTHLNIWNFVHMMAYNLIWEKNVDFFTWSRFQKCLISYRSQSVSENITTAIIILVMVKLNLFTEGPTKKLFKRYRRKLAGLEVGRKLFERYNTVMQHIFFGFFLSPRTVLNLWHTMMNKVKYHPLL